MAQGGSVLCCLIVVGSPTFCPCFYLCSCHRGVTIQQPEWVLKSSSDQVIFLPHAFSSGSQLRKEAKFLLVTHTTAHDPTLSNWQGHPGLLAGALKCTEHFYLRAFTQLFSLPWHYGPGSSFPMSISPNISWLGKPMSIKWPPLAAFSFFHRIVCVPVCLWPDLSH